MYRIIEITDLSVPELDIYARLSESQLYHYFEPKPGLFLAESPNVIERALRAGYEPISMLTGEKQLEGRAKEVLEKCGDIPVYVAKEEVLSGITGFQLTRGVLCAMRRRPLASVEEVCGGARRIAVLDRVMNPTNVGAIFRSAAALNMDAVLLTKGSSDPLQRRAIRVSMGTVFQVPWTYLPENGMECLKKNGYTTVAMALKEDSVPLESPELKAAEKLAVIMGTEGDGLSDETILDCDYTVMIPMSHGVDSLNVAAASAVAFWELGKSSPAVCCQGAVQSKPN